MQTSTKQNIQAYITSLEIHWHCTLTYCGPYIHWNKSNSLARHRHQRNLLNYSVESVELSPYVTIVNAICSTAWRRIAVRGRQVVYSVHGRVTNFPPITGRTLRFFALYCLRRRKSWRARLKGRMPVATLHFNLVLLLRARPRRHFTPLYCAHLLLGIWLKNISASPDLAHSDFPAVLHYAGVCVDVYYYHTFLHVHCSVTRWRFVQPCVTAYEHTITRDANQRGTYMNEQ